MLHTFINWAKTVLSAFAIVQMTLKKRLHFLNFPIAKGGTKTIVPLSIAEGLSF